MSVVGAGLGTRDPDSLIFVDGTCGALCFGTDGGGSANSVVDVVSSELL